MKRNSSQTSNSASSASKSSKRQKTSQACTSCRKSKTRCEILENREQGTVKCHRCKVLKVHCSYQDMDKSELPMEESLRKPRVDNDANSSSRFSNAAVHAQTMQWEQRALAIIESANGSTLLKNITPEGQRSSTRRYMIWDWFRVPQGHVYDWTAPLDTVRELVNSVFDSEPKQAIAVAPSPESVANDSLAKVLTSDQIEHLLDLFSQYYTPWLNLTLIRTAENPMLDLVCCTISSRHLDEPTRSAVATRLQALTKDCCAKLIFQSRNSDSIEAIQCLLILSLWAPLCGNSEDFGDRRTLIGSAVSMAMNCHLNEACDKALKLQTAKKKGDEVDESDLIDAINRSRLWLSVANTESMLCIGSGRLALSKRNYEIYRDLFPTHPTLSLFPLDLDTGRDARLRLLSELCDAMETGLAIPFQSVSEDDVERWYDSLTHVFQNMARLLRLCLPLGVLADSEKFHYQMLVIQNKFFRLLLLHHALASCRTHQNENQSARATLWFQEIRPRGIFLVIAWSRESFQLSEAFLISILEMDSSLLRIAPDYLFTMIPFAAGYAISSNYFALKGLGVHIPGSTMRIIERIVVHLMQASVSEDSPARKCAQLISVMLALYNAKAKELTETPRRSVVDILGSYDPWLGTAKKPESQIPDNSSTLSLPKMPEFHSIPSHNSELQFLGHAVTLIFIPK
ncbi:hypothetical protein K435DRAFT_965 [Dendrothele bispora CBS 962.96]|uniref:Zn(2)-C6 fungal-type domain-containing protein n=1 Tax=Dendrothele bispora (strain CBS 962.96) TaxID=1314807 RepID=A0A4S8MY15_DENBC|nr:hypothetical protein K435DRAFT_965 [Dendrothele bispora CBS 962.96]